MVVAARAVLRPKGWPAMLSSPAITIIKVIFLNIFMLLCMAADLKLASYPGRLKLQHVSPAEPDSDFSVAEIATLGPNVVGDPGPTAGSSLSFALIASYQLDGTTG